ncbi:hypothetical protein ARHIZOSPH14_06860 [Agromyces rhizosphaerae]|uniref:Uncharacterized protein n=1 Tax=Agromyces rhizosphaerae TaxID=88374 RepID=A0A9W6FN02_9MICO|nr:hypothetical protein ARHIZOSPH14_06860 [Agromyces rhizosphaerae]
MTASSPRREDVATIRELFNQRGGASLKLPEGWFGRPFDNWHQLSDVELDGPVLVITVDDSQILRIRTAGRVTVEGRTLRVPVTDGTWSWVPYGHSGEAPRIAAIGAGTVEFHAPWGEPRL